METNKIIQGDCIEQLKELPDNSVDAIITDPPYGLEFMGKDWDKFKEGKNIAGGTMGNRNTPYQRGDKTPPAYYIWTLEQKNEFQIFSMNWAKECLRVLKPGGYLLSFGGTRTYHRMACGIEDAGFEIRDCIMWLYGCLSEDSEILTNQGWKRYDKISEEDIVYSLNLKTGSIERSKVENIFVYNHKGKMINLKNDNTDQLITPNHKVIMKKEFREQKEYNRRWYCPENWSWEYANQIQNYGKYNLPLGAVYNGYLSCGVDFASLLGWILSEGHFQKDTEAINIYQSSVNKDKVDMIKELLNRLNIKHSEYKRKRRYKERNYIEHQFYFSGDIVKTIKEWIPNKKPTNDLWNLKYEEKIALFNSLMLGDGSKKSKSNYITFYQNNLDFLEWFQVLCHLIGKQARINEKKMSVEVHHNPNTQFQAKQLKNRIKEYNGIVWSIQTNNMSYIARRNGKIFITGNSGFPKSLNIGKAVDKLQGNERKIIGYKEPFGREGRNTKPTGNYNAGLGGNYTENKKDLRPIYDSTSEWEGWGTALKPAVEPIVVARKPLSEKNVALNVLKWGTGGINIDECRIEHNEPYKETNRKDTSGYKEFAKNCGSSSGLSPTNIASPNMNGRFPANIILEKSYQQLYTLKESFINLIPLLNQYYGNYYMFKLQEKISNLQEQNKGQSWKVLSEEMLLQMDERKEKSNGRQETQEGINTKDDREKEEYSKRKEQQEIQRVLDEQGIQVSQQRRINSPTENMGESDDQENRNPRTQDSYGDTSQQTIKDFGDSPSQEWSEERQQNRESGDDGKLNTQERTQRDIKRIKAITKGERGFIVCDCDLPKEWRDFFEPTIIEIDYPFSSAKMLDEQTGNIGCSSDREKYKGSNYGTSMFLGEKPLFNSPTYTDKGGASRFFYVAKASKSERNFGCEGKEEIVDCDRNPECYSADVPFNRSANPKKNNHPTVKPIKLMEYLIKLVTKENAIVLDPFLGSGTTAIACLKLNRQFIGIEKEPEYIKIAEARIKPYLKQIQLNSEEAVLETII